MTRCSSGAPYQGSLLVSCGLHLLQWLPGIRHVSGGNFLRLVLWLPAGSQLETRAIALLKKLQSSAHQAPLSFGGRSKARRSSAGRSRSEPQYSLNDAPLPMRKRQVSTPTACIFS